MLSPVLELIAGIHFTHPAWLLAWLPAVLALGLLIRAKRLRPLTRETRLAGAQTTYRHPRHLLLRQLLDATHPRRTNGRELRTWMQYTVILLCFCAALAQPYRHGRQLPSPPRYHDMYFLIGASLNMSLRDYRVNGKPVSRMFVLKHVLRDFIDHLQKHPTNRIGLIVFSEQPFTLVPPTADPDLLRNAIGLLHPAVLTGRTTNLGKALLYTLKQLQAREPTSIASKPVLVLFTGVNWTYRNTDPRAIAAYLHTQGYRLYTVGIGASDDGQRHRTRPGLIYEPADFALMKAIAAQGGGRFYRADTDGNLKAAIRSIQAAQIRHMHAAKSTPRYVSIPLYRWPLLAGLAWLMLVQLFVAFASRR